MDKTKVYDNNEFEEALVEQTVKEVYEILEDCGYNPVNQIVGYIISGDPGYISSHKEARKKIQAFDRNQLLAVILKRFMKK
ncbi:MAG: IreB family regulatory phosphoprotein [Bacilli bacterium]|nr:IreB family regulatory phosphoprotein [Bacilli bacterium]